MSNKTSKPIHKPDTPSRVVNMIVREIMNAKDEKQKELWIKQLLDAVRCEKRALSILNYASGMSQPVSPLGPNVVSFTTAKRRITNKY